MRRNVPFKTHLKNTYTKPLYLTTSNIMFIARDYYFFDKHKYIFCIKLLGK